MNWKPYIQRINRISQFLSPISQIISPNDIHFEDGGALATGGCSLDRGFFGYGGGHGGWCWFSGGEGVYTRGWTMATDLLSFVLFFYPVGFRVWVGFWCWRLAGVFENTHHKFFPKIAHRFPRRTDSIGWWRIPFATFDTYATCGGSLSVHRDSWETIRSDLDVIWTWSGLDLNMIRIWTDRGRMEDGSSTGTSLWSLGCPSELIRIFICYGSNWSLVHNPLYMDLFKKIIFIY